MRRALPRGKGSAQRAGGKISQPYGLAIRQGHARVGPIGLVKMIAKDHSPASVLDFEVKLRGIAEVHFDGNARHALVQNLGLRKGVLPATSTEATTAPRPTFE